MTVEVEEIIEQVAPLSSWYVVMRPFDGGHGLFVIGEVVDTSEWRHAKSLVERRYIQPLPHGVEVPAITKQADGSERRMVTSLVQQETKSERPTPSRKKQ